MGKKERWKEWKDETTSEHNVRGGGKEGAGKGRGVRGRMEEREVEKWTPGWEG